MSELREIFKSSHFLWYNYEIYAYCLIDSICDDGFLVFKATLVCFRTDSALH